MVKSFVGVLYHGSRIFFTAFKKTLMQEIELSREAAMIRYSTQKQKYCQTQQSMSIKEAKLILNVQDLNREEIEKQYKHLFEANCTSNSGSFYLKSKVFRAKERLDAEIKSNHIKNLQKRRKLQF